jgi:hypothetical protein
VFSQQSTESCGESRGHQQYLPSAFADRTPESREILLRLRIEPATFRPRPDHHHHCATCLKSRRTHVVAYVRWLTLCWCGRRIVARSACDGDMHGSCMVIMPEQVVLGCISYFVLCYALVRLHWQGCFASLATLQIALLR